MRTGKPSVPCFALLCAAIFPMNLTNSAGAQSLYYPSSQPQVTETADSLTILFPQQVGIVLHRNHNKAISGIGRLYVGHREVLSATPQKRLPPLALEMISDDKIPGITHWPAYLARRAGHRPDYWPSVGGRELATLEIQTFEYAGYEIDTDSVVVLNRINRNGFSGELHWVFSPLNVQLGQANYQGMGWKIRLIGLEQATWLNIIEPALPRPGDWAFAQTWGNWIENQVGAGIPFNIDPKWYFAETQPFYFAGGPDGISVSFFDEVVAANVAIEDDLGRHYQVCRIPFGAGGEVRETPMKLWLWSDKTLSDKWASIDEWTSVYDATAQKYRDQFGLGITEAKPTIFWGWPGDEYYERYRQGMIDDFWLNEFREKELPELAKNGFRVIILQSPWESDADYPPDQYLPGSMSFGSANAPWRLEISEAIGGMSAMQKMIRRAHELEVKIIFWSSPCHLSNSSPLLVQNPDWLKWQLSGIPEDAGWGDIAGTNQRGGYYDYAVGRYRATHSDLKYDGIWQDSFLTFGVLPDYQEQQPRPSLDRSIALQMEYTSLGMTDLLIEGCGPLGLSSAGWGHEPPIPSDLDKIRGSEYGLYRYVADVYIEPDSYYRTLASKGVIGVADLAELKKLPQNQVDRIKQANFDYMAVLDKMQYRKLIATAQKWQGVEWTSSASSEVVLFAFESFNYTVPMGESIYDVTTGNAMVRVISKHDPCTPISSVEQEPVFSILKANSNSNCNKTTRTHF
ncbi:MAG: hypothetical protein ACE5I1_01585 [bacterium]